MVGFFQIEWLGVRLWIILYLVFSLIMGIVVLVMFFKEKIKGFFYRTAWPEKAIKIILFYPGNIYKIFWRLLPARDTFMIEGRPYLYADKNIQKNNDIFAKGTDKDMYVEIEGKRYDISKHVQLREKWSRHWPELHYKFNVSYPIDYSKSGSDLQWSSDDFKDFNENDLFKKLLTMDDQKNLMVILLLLCAVNLIATIFLIAKIMGWLK